MGVVEAFRRLLERRKPSAFGVPDATYLALFESLPDREDAEEFGHEYARLMQSDQRLGDQERYEILNRVFFGWDELVVDDDLRDEEDIDEAEFRRIVAESAVALRSRRDDWESRWHRRHRPGRTFQK
ncbi:MAG: hypothetical protein L0G99_11745 [Propionibacteriales bacterium]|nr:hypothetical protein [Propionibacteriales bacterium]